MRKGSNRSNHIHQQRAAASQVPPTASSEKPTGGSPGIRRTDNGWQKQGYIWLTGAALVMVVYVAIMWSQQANAAEPPAPPVVEEVAPADAEEPVPATDQESSTAGRVSKAFGYLFSGDASNIVAEVNDALEQREKEVADREEQAKAEAERLDTIRSDLDAREAAVSQQKDRLTAQREALTACVLAAIGEDTHEE
jgi:hypothetical protein